jgi:hypothetical protein
MSVTYPSSINYEQKSASAPYYQYNRILQNSGGDKAAVTADNTYTSLFDLPPQVYNLARSYIKFDLTLGTIDGGRVAALLLKVPPIRRIYLATRSGRMIADIPNFQYYWMMSKNLIVPMGDFANYPPAGTGKFLQGNASYLLNAADNGVVYFNNPNYSLPDQKATTASASNGMALTLVNNDVFSDNAVIRRKAYVSEIQYANGIATAADGSLCASCELRFDKCAFSFFGVDKDWYHTEALQLSVEWENWDHWSASLSAVNVVDAATTSTVAPTITGVQLFIAQEMNEGVRQSVMQKVMNGGLTMTVPYTTVYQQVLGDAKAIAVNVRINRGYGERLLRVISAENTTANPGDIRMGRCLYANNSLAITLTEQFYTMLDNRRLQVADMKVVLADDWRTNYPKIKNCILSNKQEYYTNCPVHIDDWSACDDLREAPQKDLQNCGLDLDVEKIYTKYITAKSAIPTLLTMLIVTQKTLMSGPQGVMIN